MAFDIDQFTANSHRVAWADLDLEAFRDDPLSPTTLRSLRYMCDVEFHTVCYLRDLLVTPSHEEEDVATFMTMWNREEFWHGEALAEVLRIHGISVAFDEVRAKRLKLGWRDRLDPVKQSVLGNLIGLDFVAVHMAWGACNEWTALAGYQRLAALDPHPVLAPLLQRIAHQESRHIAFYATQARQRLAASTKAQKLTRLVLSKFWAPVGSTIMEPAEVTHLLGHLFSGVEGAREVKKLDAHIAKLPGLGGLRIFGKAVEAHALAM